jgi:hypothetical protein
MAKSFYDLDYIIEINEKRIEQYLSAYQKVLERLTNIILIYSAITIFLISIIKIVFFNKECPWFLYTCFAAFALLFSVSLFHAVRLIIPVEIAYLDAPKKYYQEMRLTYEQTISNQPDVEKLLKASYIDELESTLSNYEQLFRRKSSFYYNALMYGLLSAVPFIICVGFHISKKEETIQKVEIINSEKISNLLKIDSMSKPNKSAANKSSDTKAVVGITTKLPGVDSTQVIPSSPIIVKENSHKVKKK